MTDYTAHVPGTPSWADVSTSDLAAAVEFYTTLFGWTAQDMGEEAGHYTTFSLRGKPVAAATPPMEAGAPVAWTTYISVDDVDKIVEVATSAGATSVMPPMDVMDLGRMGLLVDPTGAFIGLWQPRSYIGAQIMGEPGSLGWFELVTRQPDAGRDFYTEVLGWTAQTMPMGDFDYTVFNLGDKSVGGLVAMDDTMPADVPSHWLPYFEVGDADATVAQATKLGGSVRVPLTTVPTVGRFGILTDPQGGTFAIITSEQPAGS